MNTKIRKRRSKEPAVKLKSNGERSQQTISVLPSNGPLIAPRISKRFPVVGVGASAGGLDAFTHFLQNLSADTGMAFVLVQHLDPDHESALAHLLARTTSMPVIEVTNGMKVSPNWVYVIPPNTNMLIAGGVLKLQPRQKIGGAHRSIDFFFESLAQDQRELAIGIVLSGTATDGTQGLEMIKSEGGITFAQDRSAKYDSMPRSAVTAGCVDFTLSPNEMAMELARIAKHPFVANVAPNARNQSLLSRGPPGQNNVGSESSPLPRLNAFKRILLSLRNHRGVDFSLYKPNTIERRITRRMVLNQQNALDDYAQFLNGNLKELDLLYSDVLIHVTSFFRNPEAFEALRTKVFPKLLADKRHDDPVRVWALGCSSGQEAYSIAMAFTEFCDNIPRAPKLQLFATDLNEALLEKARHGLYSKSLVSDISPERLERFFVEEEGGFRVCKSIRELCVFARQNVLSDPHFSRMDLISCRNVLIYIELELQKKILPNFHYALKPGGFLMLGASESVGNFANLFESADRKQKIFSKIAGPTPIFQSPMAQADQMKIKNAAKIKSVGPPEIFGLELNAQREADRVMVNQFAPPSVLINGNLEVMQFRGATGLFLEPAGGKASFNILKMAREGLMLPLRAVINEAKKKKNPACRKNIRLTSGGSARLVNIEVIPLRNLKEPSYLILFEENQKHAKQTKGSSLLQPPTTLPPADETPSRRRLLELEKELSEARDYAQSLQEQHESANEMLQASNEEVQSANEELQSIVEELETSKEELESTNEELTTVNEEMASRNAELKGLNGDLTNLQSATNLPIVVLGRDLNIRRFSLQANQQFNLLSSDVGRPIGAVRHNLDVPDLEKLLADVIASGHEYKCEVRDKNGHWHLLHISPYLTQDKTVDGAVLVLVDVHAIKETEKAVIAARDFAEAIIRTARDPFLILDANLRVERANESFYDAFKVTRSESVGRSIFELDHGHWDIPKLRKLLEEIVPRHSFFNNFEVTHDFENIGLRTMLLNARTLSETSGQPKRILLGIQDITELLHFQNQMRRSEVRYRRLFEASRDGVLLVDPDTRKILDANPFITQLLGYSHDTLLGKELFEIGLLKDEESSHKAFEELRKTGFIRYENLPLEIKLGVRREVEFISNVYREGEIKVIQCNIRDITERKKAQQQLAEKARLLDLSNDAIIVRDLDDNISLWNKGAEKLYGWAGEEVIGKHLHSVLQTVFPKPMAEILEQLDQQGFFAGEVIQTARDGTLVPSLCRWVLDAGTQSILTSHTDISTRKKMENELRQSEERYRHLFNSMDEGFCVIEMLFDALGKPVDYRFVEVNPSFEKETGVEALGKRMLEIAPGHETFWFETFAAVVLTGQPTRFVNEAAALNRWFDVYAFRVGDQSNRRVAVLFRNITQRMESEEALQLAHLKLSDRAGELEKAVTERTVELATTYKQLEAFVYSIAHDLRGPLRSMQGFSDLLVEEANTALSAAGRDYARRISVSAQFMDALLLDLLTFSGISQQRVELTSVNLETIVDLVISCVAKEIQDKNARIEIDESWPHVIAHEGTLGPVLVNLVTNALKFIAPGVAPRVRLRAEERGEFIRVWVEDNGIGIAPEHQEQIFRLFARLYGDKYAGTGIGLAIVQKGIERMRGRTGVESALGEGSRFWLELKKDAKHG